MNYELNEVKIFKILPSVIKGDFKKQEFVVTTNEQYPQLLKFQLNNTKCELLNGLEVGNVVDISFNLRGFEWINPECIPVYINSLICWKLKKMENGYVVPTNETSPHVQHNYKFPPAVEVFGKEEDYDDLPF